MGGRLNIRLQQDRRDELESFKQLYEKVMKKELYEDSKAVFEAIRLAKKLLRKKIKVDKEYSDEWGGL